MTSVQHFIGIGDGHNYPLDYESLLAEHSSDEPDVELSEDDMVALAYTSGTTGEPKGVPFTHRCWTSGLWYEAFLRGRYRLDDIILLAVPWYVVAGPMQFLSACFAGITMVAARSFRASSFAEFVEKEKVTITYVGGTQYKLLRDSWLMVVMYLLFSRYRSIKGQSGDTFQNSE
ncbi:AMP-binding protein [Chloroflexota bacterium]